jgi:cell division transport system permease protein
MKSGASVFSLPQKNLRLDLPLDTRVGTEFVTMLMALMTFLCILAACASLSLHTMTRSWTAGLADSLTVEIPAGATKKIALDDLARDLEKIDGVREAKALTRAELRALVEPWLGDDEKALAGLPVPRLLSLTLSERKPETLQRVRDLVTESAPQARLDSHDEWLGGILRLARGFQFMSLALIAVIGLVTAMTISGAVKARMAIHHRELELLHVMGASDRYIMRQFQRYILALSGRGILAGSGLALLSLGVAAFAARRMPETLPRPDLGFVHLAVMLAVALVLCGISLLAAGRTASGVLREMP